MTIKLRNKPVIEGLHIPEEVLEETSLKNAESISVFTNESSVVMMNEAMTAWQIIRTVDMLNTVTLGLIMRLENAARLHEERCRKIVAARLTRGPTAPTAGAAAAPSGASPGSRRAPSPP